MVDVCQLDNTIDGLKITLPTGCIANAILKQNEVLGLLAYKLIENIDLSASIGNVIVGLKKCTCSSKTCGDTPVPICIDHVLYLLVNTKN